MFLTPVTFGGHVFALKRRMKLNLFVISFVILVGHLSLLQVNGDAQRNFSQELPSYEFVSIQQLQQERWKRETSNKSNSDDQIGRAIFSVRGFGKDFVLDVVQNRVLLSANYSSRYFDADGREIISKNEGHDKHCFYQGTVQGLKNSVVAISTCQGIEGMIYDGNETYYVQPFPGNLNRHIMYRTKDLRTGDKRCGVRHSDIPSSVDELISLRKHRTRRNVESETKFVELLLVNDNRQYLYLEKNKTAVEYRSKMIANLVDSLYRPLNVRVALVAVEIWSQSDKIVVDVDSDKCLDNFMEYRNRELVKTYDHDNAQLLTRQDFTGPIVGKASVMAMCGEKSGGVVQDHSSNAAATAATLAHEMGHNFGFIHDEDIDGCKCDAPAESQGCIMSAVAKSEPSTEWSSCSFETFDKFLKRGLDACLFDKPSSLFGDALCGNGFKEEGEECDCGTVEECEKYSDSCCNATTCKLHPSSECDNGPCCLNCKLKPEGSLCRDKTNECDLPEFCTGKSELCPSNKYVVDGMPCADNKGYCYKSECPSHDVQCQDLWGPDALSGPDGCYSWNENGDYRGNCRQLDINTYLKCAPEDTLCGMLHCTNIEGVKFPVIGRHQGVYIHTYGSTVCKSASVSLGLDVPDPGITLDGTKCGDNKLCVNRKCTSIETFTSGFKQCPNNCSYSNGNGVCNNEFECFCYSCWRGADCSVWEECNTEATDEPEARRSKLAGILIGIFLIILLLVGIVCAFIYRKQLMEKWRAFQQKSPVSKRYQGLSTGSPKRPWAARNGTGATSKANVEAPKPRLDISGPALQSSTRTEPAVTITPNPLGTSRFSAEPVKQDQPVSQPRVALKPTPSKPAKPEAVDREERAPKLPPVALRTREWPPKGDKKNSLNRASSPPAVTEPVKLFKPAKPPRPESHAGVQEKAPLPPSPAKKAPREWPPPAQKTDASPGTANDAKTPGSHPKVALKPVPKPIDKRFPKRPSEERPTSLSLKPSDIKKGLNASNQRPVSSANAGPKKAPLKPPGPIPPRPGTKPA